MQAALFSQRTPHPPQFCESEDMFVQPPSQHEPASPPASRHGRREPQGKSEPAESQLAAGTHPSATASQPTPTPMLSFLRQIASSAQRMPHPPQLAWLPWMQLPEQHRPGGAFTRSAQA